MKKTILTLISICFTVIIHAQIGYLDTNFGENGIIRHLLHENGFTEQEAFSTDVMILNSGKIMAQFNGFDEDDNEVGFIVQLNPDGSLDESFGDSGTLVIPGSTLINYYMDILLNNSRDIILSGTVKNDDSEKLALLAIKASGEINNQFGDDGVAIFPVDFISEGHHAAHQSTDKIVVLGYADDKENGYINTRIIVTRFNSNGDYDASFGNNGYTEIDLTPHPRQFSLPSILDVLSDNSIIISGEFEKPIDDVNPNQDVDYKPFIIKLNANGAPETQFGENGVLTFPDVVPDYYGSYINKSLILPNDQILIGGWISASWNSPNPDFKGALLILVNSDGTLDTSFGANGAKIFTPSEISDVSGVDDLKLDLDGNILIYMANYGVLKIDKNGQIVNSFANNGTLRIGDELLSSDVNTDFNIASIYLDTNGKIILAGVEANWLNGEFKDYAVFAKYDPYKNLSTEDLNQTKPKIYPNPVLDKITISKSGLSIQEIKIYDNLGRLVYKSNQDKERYDLSVLRAGVYILKIKTDAGRASYRLVKE